LRSALERLAKGCRFQKRAARDHQGKFRLTGKQQREASAKRAITAEN
jgi:hypothetical protein